MTLSAAVTGLQGLGGLEFCGAIEGVKIDIGKLLAGQFPIIAIDSIGVSIHGDLFGGQLDAALIGGILKLNASGQLIDTFDIVTPVVDRVFFIGVEGGFSFSGIGGLSIRFAMSELGPLTVQIEASVPGGILLEPTSGLSINDFVAGVEFFKTLPEIEQPEQLRGPQFSVPTTIPVDQWLTTVKQQVVTQYNKIKANPSMNGFSAAFTSPMLITGSAKLFSIYTSKEVFNGQVVVRFSTDGKFMMAGVLNFAADNLSISGKLYANLSRIASGEATVLFLADIPDQVQLLTIDGKFKMGFRNASGEEVSFRTVNLQKSNPYAKLAGPMDGATIGAGTLGGRGYIDVTLPSKDGATLNQASVIDLAPEFLLPEGSTLKLDDTQAPVHLSGNKFRYWTQGTVSAATFDIIWLKETWSLTAASGEEVFDTRGAYEDASGATVGTGDANNKLNVTWILAPYIDVIFVPGIGATINQASIQSILAAGAAALSIERRNGQSVAAVTLRTNEPVMYLGNETFRYFLADTVAAGDYTVQLAGAKWKDSAGVASSTNNNTAAEADFKVVTPTAEVVGPFTADHPSLDVNVLNAQTFDHDNDSGTAARYYIDVIFTPTPGAALDYDSILDDPGDEFSLTLTINGTTTNVTVGAAPLPIAMEFNDDFVLETTIVTLPSDSTLTLSQFLAQEGITRFRYLIGASLTTFTPGTIQIRFNSTWRDAAGNAGVADATAREFIVEGPTAVLVGPGNGGNVDIRELNNRNFIDVTFPGAPPDYSIDSASVLDLTPEFALGGAGVGTAKLDSAQAPVKLDPLDDNLWRYWLNGEFASGNVTVEFIPGSWSFKANTHPLPTTTSVTLTDKSHVKVTFDNLPPDYSLDVASITDAGPEFTVTHAGGKIIEVQNNETPERVGDTNSFVYAIKGFGYIDVTLPGGTLDSASVTDLDPEFTLQPAGASDNFSVTLDSIRVPVLVSGNTYRYFVTGTYTAGSVKLNFIAGSFVAGGTANESSAEFTVATPTTINPIAGNETVNLVFSAADKAWSFVSNSAAAYGPNQSITNPTATNGRTYIDVQFAPTIGSATTLDGNSITDSGAGNNEFVLKDGSGANLTAQPVESVAPIHLGNDVYRYVINGDFTLGVITVAFNAGAWADSTTTVNRAGITASFTVQGTIAAIAAPADGGSIGLAVLNKRGFIDVTIGLPAGQTLNLDSVFDSAAEFTIDAPAGGANYSLTLDNDQVPVLLSQNGSSYVFRYWVIGSYTNGDVSVSFIANSFVTTVGAPNAAYGTNVANPATANIGYLDVAYQPVSGYELDADSITDAANEFALGGTGKGSATLSTTHSPVRLTRSNTFRYFVDGDFAAGDVTVDFLPNTFSSVPEDLPGPQTGGIANLAATQKFTVQQLTADLADPVNGSTIDSAQLNNRGFIDVTFTLPSYAASLDVASVTDLGAEFSVTVNGGVTFALDPEQAPLLLPQSENNNTYTFRYWYTGTFTNGELTLKFIGNSFFYLDSSGKRIGNFADQAATVQQDSSGLFIVVEFGQSLSLDKSSISSSDISSPGLTFSNATERGPPGSYRIAVSGGSIAVGDTITISYAQAAWTYRNQTVSVENTRALTVAANDSLTYIDIRYNSAGEIQLETASFNGDEFTLSGAGLGTAALSTNPKYGPNRLGNTNVFRYYFSRGFTAGPLTVAFRAGAWVDEAGNPGAADEESFQLIEAVPLAEPGQPAPRVFFIEISGGVKLQGLGFTNEPIIDIRGKVVIEIGNFPAPNNQTITRFTLDASGTVKIIKLGNIGSVAARFILQTGDTVTGNPEFWGVAKIQVNLDFLKNYGIFAEGSALLQINTTPTPKSEKIALEGVPGDLIAEDLDLDLLSLSDTVLGEVGVPSWDLSQIDVDPARAGIQTINLAGAIVQTVVRGQKWKIITKDATDPAKSGPVYFLQLERSNEAGGGLDLNLRSEAQTFVLPAESFSIEIVGSLKIKANGSPDPNAEDWVILTGGFFLRITPQRFEVFVTAFASIPVLGLTGQATGLLIIDASTAGPGIPGVALMLNVELSVGVPPPNAPADDRGSVSDIGNGRIFRLTGEVLVMLNTTKRDQNFRIPDSFLPLLPAGAPPTITIFDNAPKLNGERSTEPGAQRNIYITANIQGSITLFDAITLSGFIGFTASEGQVRISGAVSTNIQYIGSLSGSIDLIFFIDRNGNGPGVVGRVTLAIADGGAIPGVVLSGQFLLEINTYSSEVIIESFQTNKEHDPSYSGNAPNILALNPTTGLIEIGNVTIGPDYAFVLEGRLIIGPVLEISGHFEFTFVADPFTVEVKAEALMRLFGIGEFNIDAVLRIDSDGLAAFIDVNLSAGFGGNLGLSFNASATLELNTGRNPKTLTKANGTPITLASGFKLRIAGEVTFLGFARASGSVTVALLADRFTVEFNVLLHLGPIDVRAAGGAGIYSDGMALVLDVEFRGNLFDVIRVGAAGKLQINTTNSSRTLAGFTIARKSFLLEVSGEVSFLEVLTFEAGFRVEVGGVRGEGNWRVSFNAGINFFGLAQMTAYGWFTSEGFFDITLDGGITLGTSDFGLQAGFHFNVGFGKRQVAGAAAGIMEYYFHVGASGFARLRAFGITLAGIEIGFDVTAAGSGIVPIIVQAHATVELLFFEIDIDMEFTLGYIELPRIVYLAGNATGDGRVWSGPEGDGVLVLNMGSRNALRGIGEGATNEIYQVEHVSSDSSGETVLVKFSGREQQFSGVKKIVAFGGSGADQIYVMEGVESPVELHGGDGNDALIHNGKGSATMYGDAGNDILQTSAHSTIASLNGGDGDDIIVHSGSGRALIHGDAGNDTITGGPSADEIFGDAGNDVIDGRGGSDAVDGGIGNDRINWSFENNARVNVNGGSDAPSATILGDVLVINVTPTNDDLLISSPAALTVRVVKFQGGSDIGSISASNLEELEIIAGGGADTLTVNYLGGAQVRRVMLDVGSGAARSSQRQRQQRSGYDQPQR